MRRKKFRSKYDLFRKVLNMWYKSERELIRLFGGEKRRLQYRQLRQDFEDYLEIWAQLNDRPTESKKEEKKER